VQSLVPASPIPSCRPLTRRTEYIGYYASGCLILGRRLASCRKICRSLTSLLQPPIHHATMRPCDHGPFGRIVQTNQTTAVTTNQNYTLHTSDLPNVEPDHKTGTGRKRSESQVRIVEELPITPSSRFQQTRESEARHSPHRLAMRGGFLFGCEPTTENEYAAYMQSLYFTAKPF